MSKVAPQSTVKPLGDVNVLKQADGSYEIVACFLPDPDSIIGEGQSKAFIALDASLSMRKVYGMGGVFGGEPNYVEPVGRKLGQILASITREAKSSAIYWAVSPEGSSIEQIGSFSESDWSKTSLDGPKTEKWGRGTKLLPVIKYGVETIGKDSNWTMGVIITDGIIEDEQETINYCLELSQKIFKKELNEFKFVIIGIGEEVDEGQMERLDNMSEGLGDGYYDLFSSGMVADMRSEEDILSVLFSELISEESVIAPTGSVTTKSGQVLISWADGMPGKFRFILPKGETSFVVKTPRGDIEQDISSAL